MQRLLKVASGMVAFARNSEKGGSTQLLSRSGGLVVVAGRRKGLLQVGKLKWDLKWEN